jgi:hypothetical protein
MNREEQFEIIIQKELKHCNNMSHWFMLINSEQRYYIAIHSNQAAIVYKQIHNISIANIIIQKLFIKLSKIKDYNKVSGLLLRAFRFDSLFQTLFFLNLYGIKKIHPNYIAVLTKRYNLRGNNYFVMDSNDQIKEYIIEVRIPPKNELFGILISRGEETFFRFELHRKFKRILRA